MSLCRIEEKCMERIHYCRYIPWQHQTYWQHKYENPFEAKEQHCQVHGRSTAWGQREMCIFRMSCTLAFIVGWVTEINMNTVKDKNNLCHHYALQVIPQMHIWEVSSTTFQRHVNRIRGIISECTVREFKVLWNEKQTAYQWQQLQWWYENPLEGKEHHCQLHGRSAAW